jgi:hypothetical protein
MRLGDRDGSSENGVVCIKSVADNISSDNSLDNSVGGRMQMMLMMQSERKETSGNCNGFGGYVSACAMLEDLLLQCLPEDMLASLLRNHMTDDLAPLVLESTRKQLVPALRALENLSEELVFWAAPQPSLPLSQSPRSPTTGAASTAATASSE